MKTTRFQTEDLTKVLDEQKIATMPELKRALGTNVDMTVFRKLRQLSYRTSYSHGGRYYTLDRTAQFDERGLWSCRSAWFSRYGTLLNTLERFVREAEAGYFARELKAELHVSVRESLLKLVHQGRVVREKMAGLYLYCCPDPAAQRQQVLSRRAKELEQKPQEPDALLSDEARVAILLFVSLLDEKRRRLYAGLEALRVGRGGDRWIAELLGLHPHTVARGRQELLAGQVAAEGVRKQGAGRTPLEKKRRT